MVAAFVPGDEYDRDLVRLTIGCDRADGAVLGSRRGCAGGEASLPT